MVDFRPLKGLRYQPGIAGDLGDVLAPPYDVISDDLQETLYNRSPYNVVRLEYPNGDGTAGSDRYMSAASTLASWREGGVLQADATPALYVYEQEFAYQGLQLTRRAIIGRVRLEPWSAGMILPHEHTLSGPKEDRLRLLGTCRTNISPVFGLYRPDGGEALRLTATAISPKQAIEATDVSGHRHRLWVVDEPEVVTSLARNFATRTIYVADGHHRYETALAYRDQCIASASRWTGEEPENFVLIALVAADDPGLLVLPIHRIVRPMRRPPDLLAALASEFDVARAQSLQEDGAGVAVELAQQAARVPGTTVLGVAGVADDRPLVLTLRDRDAVERQMPEGHGAAWRRLDVNVLQYGVLQPQLGLDLETVRQGANVEFTENDAEAIQAVRLGRAPLAFLLNPTRPEEIFAVADAGERMPQKSTYFYPKLGTGLVLYSLDVD